MKKHTNLNLSLSNLDNVFEQVSIEYHTATQAHGSSFNSSHELYAVLKEEMDEFWDSVKLNDPDPQELIQIASVAIAGIVWLSQKAAKEIRAKNSNQIDR